VSSQKLPRSFILALAVFAALRGGGVPIVSSWLDWPRNIDPTSEPSPEEWRRAAECDVLLLYAQEEERHFGSLIAGP
jgi:hypothetical protein